MEQNTALAKFKHIKLMRTGCYGSCPIYTVEIFSDGMVHFFGKDFVRQTGHHIWKIDSESIEILNHSIAQYGFFIMIGRENTKFITDIPSCITSVLLEDGTFREIDNNDGQYNYPKSLNTFQDKIDLISKDEKYISKEK